MRMDEKEGEKSRQRNAKACDALLSLLKLHHDTVSEVADAVQVVEEAAMVHPIELPATPAVSDTLSEWIRKQKEVWFAAQPDNGKITIRAIQAVTCRFYGVSMTDLLSRRRSKRISFPRQVACFLSKEITRQSLPEIGRRFGGRDHTTILHSIRKIEKMLDADPAFAIQVNAIRKKLDEQNSGENRIVADQALGAGASGGASAGADRIGAKALNSPA